MIRCILKQWEKGHSYPEEIQVEFETLDEALSLSNLMRTASFCGMKTSIEVIFREKVEVEESDE